MVEGVLWAGLCLLALTTAGPLDRFSRDVSEDYQSIDLSAYANFTANEVCFSDNEVFQKGDLMPNPGPCEECRCEPPSIVCQMVKCPVNNNGCRTIQRPNHCCPDYNCECDYNGQLYSDGERLELPDQPCQVCYCKGGEVMCTSLTCYTRSDCEPQHVPGQCCPKYTNCPLRDMAATNTDDKSVQTRSTNKTAHSPKREMQPWLLTNSAMQTAGPLVTKRPEDVTNEDGLVVIVSDWLTERKTTPENSVQGQTLQEATKPGEPHILSTEKTELITRSDHPPTKRSHDIVSPPLDEVIFTRIDSLKNQEKDIASSTHFVSNLLEDLETTNYPTKTTSSNELIYKMTESKNGWSTITPIVTTTTNNELFTHDKRLVTEENTTDQPSNRLYSGKEESSPKPEFKIIKEVTDTDLQTADMRVVEHNDKEESISKYDKKKSTQKPIKQEMDEKINLNVGSTSMVGNINTNTSMVENKIDKSNGSTEKRYDIASTNEFNPNQVKNSKFTTPISILPYKTPITEISYERSKEIPFNYKEHDVPVTNLIESSTDEMYLTTHFQKEIKNKEDSHLNIQEEHFNHLLISTKLPNEESHSLYYTTETMFTDVAQTTTPYFTEDHMVQLEVEPNRLNGDSKSVDQLTMSSREESPMDSSSTDKASYEERQAENGLNREPLTSNNRSSVDTLKITQESQKMKQNSNQDFKQPNDSVVVLSSEEAQFDIQEASANEQSEESSELPVTDIVNETTTHTERAPVNIISTSIAQSHNDLKDSDGDIESTTTIAQIKYDEPHNRSAPISNVPPVLELNSHVAFLLLGGSDNSDTSDSLEDTEMFTTTDQSEELTSTDHTVTLDDNETTVVMDENNLNDVSSVDKMPLQSEKAKNIESMARESTTMSNKDIHPTVTSSHIPLTPGDLKALAEYLIKEKIKPVEPSKNTTYSPNQWLQGNLTSEEKIASIMAAANVSVGIMNQTLKGVAVSINTKVNNDEKKNKELSSKGNRFVDDEHKKLSNEKYTYDKYSGKEASPSHNALPGMFLNDGLAVDESTDSTLDILTSLPQEVTTSKGAIGNIQLQNVSNNDSFLKSKIENIIDLRNGTNNQLKNTSTAPSMTTKSDTLKSSSTEEPINKLNDKYVSNDNNIPTIEEVNKTYSKDLDHQNLTDNPNENTELPLSEAPHHKVTETAGSEHTQKTVLVP